MMQPIRNLSERFASEGGVEGNEQSESSNLRESINENDGLQERSSENGIAQQPEEEKEIGDEALGQEEEDHHAAEEHEDTHGEETGIQEDYSTYSKAALLDEIKSMVNSENPMAVNAIVQEIKKYFEIQVEKEYKKAIERFIEEGNSEIDFKPKPDPVKDEFFRIFNEFKQRRSSYIETLNKEKEENLKKKREILDQMKEITEDAEMKGRVKAFKQLQSDWKKVGHVPKHEVENLWRSYDFYVKKFYDNLHLYSQFRELDRKKNFEKKEELCKKLEELPYYKDLKEIKKRLRQVQHDWHQIGPVPEDKHETLINRFNKAIADADAQKEALEKAIRENEEENLKAKQAIIDQIRAFQDFESEKPKDWVDKNNELETLIQQWKSIGYVPYEKKSDVAKDFKEAVRNFNYRKNQFFKRKKQERAQLLNQKEEILQSAKALLEPEDFKKAKNQLLDLQKEWKNLGVVHSKRGEELWREFREVCDEFFNRLANHYSQKEEEEQKNLVVKQQLCEKAEQYAENNLEDPEAIVKQLQEEWEQAGFVPFEYKDQVRERFNKALEAILKNAKDQLQADPELLSYKIKIDGLKEQNKKSQLETEERKLKKKLKLNDEEVEKLEQNILLFNSKSSNAQKLVDEYREKINELKKETDYIREKLDIINEE